MRTPWHVLAIVVALAAVTGGCLGNGERIEVAGQPASVPDPGDAGYEALGSHDLTVNETITITLSGDVEGRSSQEVRATIPIRTYRRTGGAAVVAVAASPHVQVIENPPKGSDPLSARSTAPLLEFVQDRYSDFQGVGETDSESVPILGNETTLQHYEATATRNGERVDVVASVARARHAGDAVTVVAIRPADEDANLAALLEGLQH